VDFESCRYNDDPMLLEAVVQPTSARHAHLLSNFAQLATGRGNPVEIGPVLRESVLTVGSKVTTPVLIECMGPTPTAPVDPSAPVFEPSFDPVAMHGRAQPVGPLPLWNHALAAWMEA
jgi:hypothetical protein